MLPVHSKNFFKDSIMHIFWRATSLVSQQSKPTESEGASMTRKTRTLLISLLAIAGMVGAICIQAAEQARNTTNSTSSGGTKNVTTTEVPINHVPKFLPSEEQLRKMNVAMQPDKTGLDRKLLTATREAINATLDKNSSELSVSEKIEAVGRIQTDLAILAFNKGMKAITLTDEQQNAMLQSDTNMVSAYNRLFVRWGITPFYHALHQPGPESFQAPSPRPPSFMLTPEQRAKMSARMQPDKTELRQKLHDAAKEALKATLDKNSSELSVSEKIEAVGRIQTDLAILAFNKGMKAITLTDEQQKTALQSDWDLAYVYLFFESTLGPDATW
jgi:hypothetical protein